MPTRFCLVRHGETAWNAQGRLQGQIDIPLNETGEAQSRAAAARLSAQRFDALYSSDLARTAQTAAAAAALLSLAVVHTPLLRERYFGGFQGLTHDEAKNRYPHDYARFHARDPDHPLPGDGESLRAFSARVEGAFLSLADQHPDQTVLVVTHGGVLDIAHRLASGLALQAKRTFTLRNAALNWIERHEAGWSLLDWADTAHLGESRDEVFDGAAARG